MLFWFAAALASDDDEDADDDDNDDDDYDDDGDVGRGVSRGTTLSICRNKATEQY